MYRKLSLFPRTNYALSECRSSSELAKRVHKSLRKLSTAVERLGFLNPNEYRVDDSSHISSDINARAGFNLNEGDRTGSSDEVCQSVAVQTQSQGWGSNSQGNFSSSSTWNNNTSYWTNSIGGSSWHSGINPKTEVSENVFVQTQSQNRTGSFEEVSGSVVVQTQSQSWGSNSSSTWNNNTSYWTNSDYRNGGSSWHSGNNKIEKMIKDFDSHCEQDHLKMALAAMESLESMGHVLDLARLLRLSQLCGDDHPFLEPNALQQAKVSLHGKIRALVYHSDANYLRYYTDFVIEEFDAFCRQGNVKKAMYTMDTLASLSHAVDLARLIRLAKLCGEVEASDEAKVVYGKISSLGCSLDVSSYHVLIEMYSNCGLMNEAFSVFEEMPEKNLETWYIVIRCLAKNGLGEDAIDVYTRFKTEGNKPDGRMFRGVFYACGLLGDVDEGLLHFMSMSKDYGIIPTMEDYVSIVEMFALPGLLDEALAFVERMPMEPNVDVWETLMNLSRVHGDLELGDRCAEIIEELDPTRLNQQSRNGYLPVKTSDVEKAILKKRSGIDALRGIATNRKHEYKAGDTSLPENDELLQLLRNLRTHMVERGYVCQTKTALHDVDEESKETALLAHSERIAFARALLNSAPRATFTVMKNLRVCIDCHNAFKIMSDIVGRLVIMRDAKRFHHMKDGKCNCGDYW